MTKCKMKIDFWNLSHAIYGMIYDFKGIYFKMSKIKFFQLQKMANIFQHPFFYQKHVCSIGSWHHLDTLKVVHIFTEQFYHSHLRIYWHFLWLQNVKYETYCKAKLFQAANFYVFIGSKFLLCEWSLLEIKTIRKSDQSMWWLNLFFKVHIFWEGHKILRNLPLTFDCMYCSQK